MVNVRFWDKADVTVALGNVRVHVQSGNEAETGQFLLMMLWTPASNPKAPSTHVTQAEIA